MRADPQAVLVTERLDRHRQRDHLAEKIIQSDLRPPIQPCLEVLPETQSVSCQPLLPFGIHGRSAARRLEHQPVRVTKRMRIALGAAAALESDPTGHFAFDQYVVPGARGGQLEMERRLDLAGLTSAFRLSRGPPIPIGFENEALRPIGQPLDLDQGVEHGSFLAERPGSFGRGSRGRPSARPTEAVVEAAVSARELNKVF